VTPRYFALVYRRKGRITHNKRGGRNKMRMKFRRYIHEDTLFNIRFHTVEHESLNHCSADSAQVERS
jgi:hypothetical protein